MSPAPLKDSHRLSSSDESRYVGGIIATAGLADGNSQSHRCPPPVYCQANQWAVKPSNHTSASYILPPRAAQKFQLKYNSKLSGTFCQVNAIIV